MPPKHHTCLAARAEYELARFGCDKADAEHRAAAIKRWQAAWTALADAELACDMDSSAATNQTV